jgi:hypothetical protein
VRKRKRKKKEEDENKEVRMTCGPICVRAGHADASDVFGPTQTWTKSGTQIGHARTVCSFG